MRERRRWVSVLLALAVVLVLVGSWWLASVVGSASASDDGSAFEGTDSVAARLVTDSGAQPWFSPLVEPGSPEVESGLFALQAALGAGIFGYAVGRLHARRLRRTDAQNPGADEASCT